MSFSGGSLNFASNLWTWRKLRNLYNIDLFPPISKAGVWFFSSPLAAFVSSNFIVTVNLGLRISWSNPNKLEHLLVKQETVNFWSCFVKFNFGCRSYGILNDRAVKIMHFLWNCRQIYYHFFFNFPHKTCSDMFFL